MTHYLGNDHDRASTLWAPRHMRRISGSVSVILMAIWSGACHGDAVTAPLSASTLVFSQDDPSGSAVYSITTDGGNRRRLTPAGILAVLFAIAPDARRIAVTAYGALPPASPIWIFDTEGRVLQRVPSPSTDSVIAFGDVFLVESWSPNGSLLVGGTEPDLAEITTGGAFHRIAADGISVDGQFSPDGSKIAFARVGPIGYEIAVMNADGSNIQFLTSGNGGADFPAWSPDGHRIVFQRGANTITGEVQENVALYMMNADGSGLAQLSPQSVYDVSPTWSPDGQQLAFLRSTDGGRNFDIYIMNADGSNAHAITSDGGLKHSVRWSPG